MQFTVLQENLKNALRVLTKAVPTKPQLPILSTILCTVGDGEVTLSATDLYMGVTVRIPASIETDGSLAIPGRMLIDTISLLPAGKIQLASDGQSMVVSSTTTKSTLQCFPPDDFPAFPDKVGQSFTLTTDTLKKIDENLSFAVGTDQARLVLTTLLFQPTDQGVEVIATDGFRLGRLRLDATELQLTTPLLVPAAALSEVFKIAEQQDKKQIEFTLSEEQKQLFFTIEDTTLYVRLVEGQFPPYQKILPTGFTTQAEVDGPSLLEHIKQAQVVAREVSNIIALTVSADSLVTSVTGSAQGAFSATLPVTKHTGETITIAFNSRYLLDFLAKTKPEQIFIGLNDSLKPALFRPADNPHYEYVVMPFRVNQA